MTLIIEVEPMKDPFRPAECWSKCPKCDESFGWNKENGLAGQMCPCGHVFTGHERRAGHERRVDKKSSWSPGEIAVQLSADEAKELLALLSPRKVYASPSLTNIFTRINEALHPKTVHVCTECGSPDGGMDPLQR